MKLTLEAIHSARRSFDNIADELDFIARAMETMGMERPAVRLQELAEAIVMTHKRIDTAFNDDINIQVREQQAGLGNVLKAILEMDPKR